MPTAKSNSRPSTEDFFNDLSQNPSKDDQSSESPQDGVGSNHSAEGGEGWVPRPKRIACILCRKRKLRCDGNKPSCGTCSRLGHDCAYDEVRKKSGPKRGYVKLLEARLKQVETLLESRDSTEVAPKSMDVMQDLSLPTGFSEVPTINLSGADNSTIPNMIASPNFVDPTLGATFDDLGLGANGEFSWEMIGLGLEEPLPSQEIIDDMNQIYFEKIHPSVPIIHRPRFFAAMDLAPHLRPPVCLRYAMWANACSVTPRYHALVDHFYARARKYAEQDEMRGHGESMITLAHPQAWTLIAGFEFKMMYFPRAWMSTGRATRLTQMMGLHRQDGIGLDVKQTLAPPRDWTEREERRRTFWMAFCQDRYASIGTGWPMGIDEQDILTNLPATDEAFNKSKPEPTLLLSDAMTADGASTLSPFAGVTLLACLFGRNLTHLHRPHPEDRDHDLNGEFWKRHRELDNILLNTSLSLPAHLRLPAGINNSSVVFLNMSIHTSTICLHQAAIFKADKNRMPAQIGAESKRRCIIAADQITNIMKMTSHLDISSMNPFVAFSLYVAARVFVQYLKSRKDDLTVKSSLQFLLSAMQALKSKNPLTESFLVQLDVDLEGSGLGIKAPVQEKGHRRMPGEIPINTDSVKCSPLFEIREGQVQAPTNAMPRPQPSDHQLHSSADLPLKYSTTGAFQQHPPLESSLPRRSKEPHFGSSLIYAEPQNLTEMDTSPDPSADSRQFSRPHSDHPTPSSTSNKTSHTSFTPPGLDDNSVSTYPSSSSNISPGVGQAHSHPLYQSTTANGAFNSTYSTNFGDRSADGPLGMNTPFSMPAGWDYSNDGPANTGTGLKPHNAANLSTTQQQRAQQQDIQQTQQQMLQGQQSGQGGAIPTPTGLTPMQISDSPWPGMNMMEGNEWMYGDWTTATPQQE